MDLPVLNCRLKNVWRGFPFHKRSRFHFVVVEKGAYWEHGTEKRGGLRE